MRRFEFVEGTSSKFWEIGLEGSGFTVRWGRIGAAGQSQQKSFANEVKARAEHDKLVAQKLKKGYVESGGAKPKAAAEPAVVKQAAPAVAKKAAPAVTKKAAPAAAKKAAPAAAKKASASAPVEPAPQDDQRPVVWDDAYLRRVHPRRGHSQVPIRPLWPANKAWRAVRELFATFRPGLERGRKMTKAGRPALESLLSKMASDAPPALSAEDAAWLIAVIEFRPYGTETTHTQAVSDFLVASAGAPFATIAVLQAIESHVEGGTILYLEDGKPVSLESEPGVYLLQPKHAGRRSASTIEYLTPSSAVRLRQLLCLADDATYRAARDAAAKLKATPDQQALRAYLFPTEKAWSDAEAQRFTRESPFCVLTCLSGKAALARVAPGIRIYHLDRSDDVFPSILDGAGADALPFFKAIRQRITTDRAEAKHDWADAVARINSDEAAELLLEVLDKDFVSAANALVERWPSRALRLLAREAVARGKAGEMHRTLLAKLVRGAPAVVDAQLAKLSSEEQKLVASLRGKAAPGLPDADAKRLPPVLVNPPWSQGKRAELPVVQGVTAPDVPPAMRWSPGEREDWAHRRGIQCWMDPYENYSEQQWEKLRKASAVPQLNGLFFLEAPEDIAVRFVPAWDLSDRWEDSWVPRIAARLEMKALPLVRRALEVKLRNAEYARPFATVELAMPVARAFAGSRGARPHAKAWMVSHPEHAAAGLLAAALGKPCKDKDAACDALRLMASNGKRDVVLDVARRASVQARDAVEQILSFDPLLLFPDRLPKLPPFFDVATLPRPRLKDGAAQLPPSAVEVLATMLAFSELEAPYAGLAQVKQACDPASLADFAWGLFDAWMVAGAPGKEAWAFRAVGALGNDECARKLAPLIRSWPGESAFKRAVLGLDVLAAIGTEVTLTYLNGIAEKVKFKGLQEKAREKIAELAQERGLAPEELADRLVPDLGLDDDGSLQLDFGERTFTVGFDEQLVPYVKDAEGARLGELPKPAKKDDPPKAAAAGERWKALKKDAKEIASVQLLRLELAMCARRRWPAEAFRQLFVEHPLLVHVVRRLLWATYGDGDRVQQTFRVAEDRSFADVHDEAWMPPDGARVGLVHALELDAEAAAKWGQLFSDYELLQPFPQLGRPVFAATDAERKSLELDRVKGVEVPTGRVLGLEARGWRRGQPQDDAVVFWMEKPLSGNRIVELDLDPGIPTLMPMEEPRQILGAATLRLRYTSEDEGRIRLGELDPISFSELVRDLEGLRA